MGRQVLSLRTKRATFRVNTALAGCGVFEPVLSPNW